MIVAEAISQALVAEGVRLSAGITGQSVGLIADALISRPELQMYYTRQERVATMLAEPEDHHTPLRGSKLWQLGLLELWLQAHGL